MVVYDRGVRQLKLPKAAEVTRTTGALVQLISAALGKLTELCHVLDHDLEMRISSLTICTIVNLYIAYSIGSEALLVVMNNPGHPHIFQGVVLPLHTQHGEMCHVYFKAESHWDIKHYRCTIMGN